MKILIVISIYDRFENMKKWIHSWNLSNKMRARLVFVHNYDSVNYEWKEYCEKNNVEYLHRNNVGYETGIIQDVIFEKLEKGNDWDVLFFATDDTIPMSKDFLEVYVDKLQEPNVGCVCMEISGNVTPHIRTTGWCITKEDSKKLHFPHIPIRNKDQCYHFEHLGGQNTLFSQVLRMNKRVIQQDGIEKGVLWDTHHNINLYRWEEWNNEFPGYNN